jgi:hypothetical protein
LKQRLIIAELTKGTSNVFNKLFFYEEGSSQGYTKELSLESLLEKGWKIKIVGDWHSATPSGPVFRFIQTIILEKEEP